MSDRIFGGVCVVLAAAYVYFALQVQTAFISDPLGPKAFPVIIGVILAIGGTYAIARPDADPSWPGLGRLLEIGFAIAVMVAYTYALPTVGFVVSTTAAAGLLSWRLGATPLRAVIAGVSIAVGIFVVFRLILKLSLAVGPWGF